MSFVSLDDLPESRPPALPSSPPPSLSSSPPPALPSSPPPILNEPNEPSSPNSRRSPLLFPPEKPPRTFSDASGADTSKTLTPASSPPPSPDSFRTPPNSIHLSPDAPQATASSESSKEAEPSPDAVKKASFGPVPIVSVVAADADSTNEDVFVDAEDQSSVLLRKPSFRRKLAGDGESIKRVVSARIDRIGSAISRLLDRDKNSSVRERPRSMSALESTDVRHTGTEKIVNENGENKNSLVPYGSNFLRRSFRQKSNELDDQDPEQPESSAVSSVSARNSIYNEDLVASLVCAACARYMVAPIEQCKRGHNICKFCRRRAHQHRCPACGARLSGIRNRVAEDMASKLLFPCVHAHAGCTRQVPNDELEFHEPRCPFRVYNCLINVASGVPCKWQGRRVAVEDHVRQLHPRYYSAQETTKWRWSPNLLVKMEDFQLISAFGELFWYCAAQDPERLRVCWFVQHIGFDQDSVKFEFHFLFVSDDKDRRVEMSSTTLPDYSSVASIIESGHCLDMSYQQALSFLDEDGTIKFSVTICKLD